MAYPHAGNRLAFFEPVMAIGGTDAKPLCSIDIGASSATHGEFVCVVPCVVRHAKFTVLQEAAAGTTTAPTVVLTKFINPGAGSTSTAVATITIPTGTAIGKVIYKDSLAVTFNVGDVMEIKHTVGVGSPTGMGNVDWYCEYDPENFANNSDLSASST